MDIKNEPSETAEHIATGSVEEPTEIHARTIIAVAAACFSTFAQLLAIVGSGSLGRAMATSLGSSTLSGWFGAIITIVNVSTMLQLSKASDFWGRKWFLLIGNALGVVGFIIASRAHNIATSLAGFVIGSLALSLQPLCYTIPSEVLPRKYRGYGQAASNIFGGAGATVGVLIGGALTRSNTESWRIYWYIVAGIFAIAFLCILFGYNPPPRELQSTMSTMQKLGSMDWFGSLTFAGSLILIVIALQWAYNPYPWASAHVLAPLIVGLCLLLAFGLWEWKGTSEGILHHRLFQHRNFALASTLFFAEGLSFFTVNNYFAFEVSVVTHIDSFGAGLRFVVLFIASIVVAFATGAYITIKKQVREVVLTGFLFLTIFCILMVYYKESFPVGNAYGYAVIGGVGLGIILTSALVAAQMGTPADMISLGTALPLTTRSLGGAVGIAINNAIFNNTIGKQLPKKIAEAVLPLGFDPKYLGELIGALSAQNQAAVGKIPGITPQMIGAAVNGLTEAYRLSFKNLWIAASCFAATGVIAAAFLVEQRAEYNQHIDAPVETKVLTDE